MMISKGKPLGSIIPLIFYNIAIIICCIFAKELGFEGFVVFRALSVMILVIGYIILCKPFLNINPLHMLKNLIPAFVGSIFMAGVCLIPLSLNLATIPSIVVMLMAVVIYFSFMYIVFKKEIINFLSIIFNKKN